MLVEAAERCFERSEGLIWREPSRNRFCKTVSIEFIDWIRELDDDGIFEYLVENAYLIK